MGRQHRVEIVIASGMAAALVLCGVALSGCSRKSVEQERAALIRRDLLRANDLAAERQKALDAVRTIDADGNLVASDERVAGIVLPRGYKPRFTFEHEWYYDGEKPYGKLVRYFTEQLESKTVEHPSGSSLRFVLARTKGDEQMTPVTVTVSPVPGREDWSRIQIVAPPPPPAQRPTAAQIKAELALRRQYMD